jgi:hypothetical protein
VGKKYMVSSFHNNRHDQIDRLCSVLESAMDTCDKLGLELVAARITGALDALQTDWDMVSKLNASETPEQCC